MVADNSSREEGTSNVVVIFFGSSFVGQICGLGACAEQDSGSPHLGRSVGQARREAARSINPLQKIVKDLVQAALWLPAQTLQFLDTRNAVPVIAAAVFGGDIDARGTWNTVQDVAG